MPRRFTTHIAWSRRSLSAEVLISVLVAFSAMVALQEGSHAQSPALTTITEVRYSDAGWGLDNDRNLIGRFTSRSFTLTRYARGQSYFLKGYDGSSPPKYSRYAAALYVDYPL